MYEDRRMFIEVHFVYRAALVTNKRRPMRQAVTKDQPNPRFHAGPVEPFLLLVSQSQSEIACRRAQRELLSHWTRMSKFFVVVRSSAVDDRVTSTICCLFLFAVCRL